MKRPINILAVVALVIAVFGFTLVDRIPPRSLTATRMHVLKRRILQYARVNGELPKSLAELPVMKGFDNSFQDGWKQGIQFEVFPPNVVTLRSFGRDAVVGGTGEDADILRSFPARDAKGQWSDEMVEWSEDTFRK